ncbi:MAG: rod-binding protein [Magnetovibrionaceae bacterium]
MTAINTQTGAEAAMLYARQAPKVNLPKGADMQKMRETAEKFEATFLAEMIKPMFEGIEPDSLTGGGSSEQMFRSLQVEEYAKSMTKSGGIGLADSILEQMIRMQEQQPAVPQATNPNPLAAAF